MAASAVLLVTLAGFEGYRQIAYTPIEGDVLTIGFGTTTGVRSGDSMDPVTALNRKLADIQRYEGAIKQCVTAALHQREYDAYVSLSYNIGPTAFCGSTLVRLLNAGDYAGACAQILRWNKFKGRVLRGLTIRREVEHKLCLG